MVLEQVLFRPSPNHKGNIFKPLGIIVHWTGGSLNGALAWMCSEKSKVSAHFLVGVNQQIYQLVDTQNIAWHAGKSKTKFGESCNGYTIGIELEGPPSKLGLDKWSESQIFMAAQLCKEIVKHHPSIEFITDHSTVCPGRKFDVKRGIGEDLFPWSDFVTMTGIKDYDNLI
jgi:N-acetylmuramoyl-L-alanine amidase